MQVEEDITNCILWLLGEMQVSFSGGREPVCKIWSAESSSGWYWFGEATEFKVSFHAPLKSDLSMQIFEI